MYPILLTFGSWEIRSYGVILFLAIVLGVVVCWHEAKRVGLLGEQVLAFCAGAILFGLIGAHLNDWLFHLKDYRALPGLDALSHGGLSAFGGIVGALAFGVVYARRHGWSIWAFLDLLAPVIPLVEGVMRWGCLLNGCCYGRETSGFLGLYLPDVTGHWANRYPTQMMLSVFNLALFTWLWRRRHAQSFDGALILSYLLLYHAGRIVIDALRGDQRACIGPLTAYQLTAVAIIAIATVIMLYRVRTE